MLIFKKTFNAISPPTSQNWNLKAEDIAILSKSSSKYLIYTLNYKHYLINLISLKKVFIDIILKIKKK